MDRKGEKRRSRSLLIGLRQRNNRTLRLSLIVFCQRLETSLTSSMLLFDFSSFWRRLFTSCRDSDRFHLWDKTSTSAQFLAVDSAQQQRSESVDGWCDQMWPSSVLCCCLRHWNRRQKSKIKQLPDRNEKKEEEEWEHTDTLRQSILLTFSIDFFLLLLFFKKRKKKGKNKKWNWRRWKWETIP